MAGILIAEGRALFAQALAVALADEGFDTHVAHPPTKEAVLDAARALRPELVLLGVGHAAEANEPLIRSLVDDGKQVVALQADGDLDLATVATAVVPQSSSFTHLLAVVEAATHVGTAPPRPVAATP
jgi:DNA-binding response OmpR family regulator